MERTRLARMITTAFLRHYKPPHMIRCSDFQQYGFEFEGQVFLILVGLKYPRDRGRDLRKAVPKIPLSE